MNFLKELFGEDWVESVIRSADSQHSLARWRRKDQDNPVQRYDDIAKLILKTGSIKCDPVRLGTKLKAEFPETLMEMGYAAFLAKQGFQVTMEPFAPEAGAELAARHNNEYFIELRKVGLDEARAAADSAAIDLFRRLERTPSSYTVVISMTDEFGAYSPQLKKAAKSIAEVLNDLGARGIANASLYYWGPDEKLLIEGDEGKESKFDYADQEKLKAQFDEFEKLKTAPFVARFASTGSKSDHTPLAVHGLGKDPKKTLQPDKTHLRLRAILHQKREPLPPGKRGIIVLDLTDLEKIGVDQWTIKAALYGDMKVTIARAEGEGFESSLDHRANGFFAQTSRVSAVVVERTKITENLETTREVFPTNNAGAIPLTQVELERFGTLVAELAHLCRPE
jgi:hypothetical protein